MDLKTFVSETLTQIVEGVQEAAQKIADGGSGAAVNPTDIGYDSDQTHARPTPVEFDVAVLVSDETSQQSADSINASVGILTVLTAKAAAGMENQKGGAQRNETASRIKFFVNLAQPGLISRARPVRIPPARPRI